MTSTPSTRMRSIHLHLCATDVEQKKRLGRKDGSSRVTPSPALPGAPVKYIPSPRRGHSRDVRCPCEKKCIPLRLRQCSDEGGPRPHSLMAFLVRCPCENISIILPIPMPYMPLAHRARRKGGYTDFSFFCFFRYFFGWMTKVPRTLHAPLATKTAPPPRTQNTLSLIEFARRPRASRPRRRGAAVAA